MSSERASLSSATADPGAIGLSLFAFMAIPSILHRNIPLIIAFVALIGLLLFLGAGFLSANLTAKPPVPPSVNELRISGIFAFVAAAALWFRATGIVLAIGKARPSTPPRPLQPGFPRRSRAERESSTMDVFRGRRRLSLLVGLAALALLAGMVPAAAAARQFAAQPATRTPDAPAPSGSRCDVNFLQSALHLAQVTVNSAAVNTTGSFTSPGQPTLTGLPAFCDVTLTQTDTAGNPIHIEAWLPAAWNGRFQGVGGAVYECGPRYTGSGSTTQASSFVCAE